MPETTSECTKPREKIHNDIRLWRRLPQEWCSFVTTHLPWLGGDQCGDFYYMSPWIQYIFGIVDNATHFLDAFIWGEGTTNRGADNIVSCLNKYLTKYGVVGKEQSTCNQAMRGPNLKRLVIIADNCSGQNKDNVSLNIVAG